MCDFCGGYVCPPNCPNYNGYSAEHGRPLGYCRICGDVIYADSDFYRVKKSFYCRDCGEEVDIRRCR